MVWARENRLRDSTARGSLSSPERDRTHIPRIAKWIRSHWTTREVPMCVLSSGHQGVWYRQTDHEKMSVPYRYPPETELKTGEVNALPDSSGPLS